MLINCPLLKRGKLNSNENKKPAIAKEAAGRYKDKDDVGQLKAKY